MELSDATGKILATRGIDTGAVRLVVQCLNHYATAGICRSDRVNPLKAKLNPICHLLALLGAHPILHVRRIRVNCLKRAVFEITGRADWINQVT